MILSTHLLFALQYILVLIFMFVFYSVVLNYRFSSSFFMVALYLVVFLLFLLCDSIHDVFISVSAPLFVLISPSMYSKRHQNSPWD